MSFSLSLYHETLPITFSSLASFNDPPLKKPRKLTKIVRNYRPFIIVFLCDFLGTDWVRKWRIIGLRKTQRKRNLWISRRISVWECSRTNNVGKIKLRIYWLCIMDWSIFFFSVKTIFAVINLYNFKCRCLHFRTTILFIFISEYDSFLFLQKNNFQKQK